MDRRDYTKVDAVIEHYRYTGLVATRGWRLAEVLNDGSTSIVELEQVVIQSVAHGRELLRCDSMVLRKDAILLAFPHGEHEAPIRRANNRVEKRQFGAVVTLHEAVLSGLVHLPDRSTARMLLAEDSTLPRFIAITNVAVHSAPQGLMPARCGVIIVQRKFIEAAELSRATRQPSVAGPAAEAGLPLLGNAAPAP